MFFKNIIGQQAIKERLIQSVLKGFIPHAQLFAGGEGVGALPLAIAYARYLNCTNKQEDDACGICPSCVKFNKLAHPDLHFVFPIVKNDKKKKEICDDYLTEWRSFFSENIYFNLSQWLDFIGAENSQGMIYAKESNEIIKKLNLKTYEAEYKIMIIWLPEKMHESCANKLLKILEEPSAKTVFILVSENPDQVIGTIQSRSQFIHIPPIAPEDMTYALSQTYTLDDEDLHAIVHLANGNYIKALETLNAGEENKMFLELFITIMRNSWSRDVKNMKKKANDFADMGREKQKSFLSYAQRLIRENFLYRLQLPEINYLNKAESEFSVKFSPFVNERNVISFMEDLALGERHIEQNVNPRMVFFDLSMKIAVLLKK
ncbi:MAG: DNA polymerase III subunit delta [Dysgonamonadaceae bacterium]|jgi:DNA polymerase-3 subunit delta'|nr:DNA polymerase III subunit delta [Dysgonamonadaceae bacterium]